MSTTRRFVLFEPAVAGLRHHTTRPDLEALRPGDDLTLVREPENPHDYHAVRIDRLGKKLGYVPASHSQLIAGLLDHGYEILALIGEVWPSRGVVTVSLIMPVRKRR